MPISAGRLRHRIQIQEYVELLDSDGDVLQDPNTGEVPKIWSLVAEQWAAIEPLSAREFIQSDAKQSQITGKVIMRTPDRIHAGMRLVHMVNGVQGEVFNIHGLLRDLESGLEYMTIPVSSGVSINGQ